jgi:hypothetical protein
MSCDSFLPDDEMNERLHTEYGDDNSVQLAYDRLVIYWSTLTQTKTDKTDTTNRISLTSPLQLPSALASLVYPLKSAE